MQRAYRNKIALQKNLMGFEVKNTMFLIFPIMCIIPTILPRSLKEVCYKNKSQFPHYMMKASFHCLLNLFFIRS